MRSCVGYCEQVERDLKGHRLKKGRRHWCVECKRFLYPQVVFNYRCRCCNTQVRSKMDRNKGDQADGGQQGRVVAPHV